MLVSGTRQIRQLLVVAFLLLLQFNAYSKDLVLSSQQKEKTILSRAGRKGIFRRRKNLTKTIDVDGVKREYILYLPPMQKMPEGGFPIVFVFHGGTGKPSGMQKMMKVHTLGREKGFIVVYPGGLYRSWNTDIISVKASEKKVDDLAFFHRLLDYLIAKCRGDPNRVYLCGISNGGHISYYLTKKAPERIAALAVIASGLASLDNYLPPTPRPIMVIHGTADKFIPYKGGKGKRDWYLPVETTLKHLLRVNQASTIALPYNPYPGFKPSSEIDTFFYKGDYQGEDVAFIRVNGGGHSWPGSPGYIDFILGKTSQAISANQAIWEFFKNHPR